MSPTRGVAFDAHSPASASPRDVGSSAAPPFVSAIRKDRDRLYHTALSRAAAGGAGGDAALVQRVAREWADKRARASAVTTYPAAVFSAEPAVLFGSGSWLDFALSVPPASLSLSPLQAPAPVAVAAATLSVRRVSPPPLPPPSQQEQQHILDLGSSPFALSPAGVVAPMSHVSPRLPSPSPTLVKRAWQRGTRGETWSPSVDAMPKAATTSHPPPLPPQSLKGDIDTRTPLPLSPPPSSRTSAPATSLFSPDSPAEDGGEEGGGEVSSLSAATAALRKKLLLATAAARVAAASEGPLIPQQHQFVAPAAPAVLPTPSLASIAARFLNVPPPQSSQSRDDSAPSASMVVSSTVAPHPVEATVLVSLPPVPAPLGPNYSAPSLAVSVPTDPTFPLPPPPPPPPRTASFPAPPQPLPVAPLPFVAPAPVAPPLPAPPAPLVLLEPATFLVRTRLGLRPMSVMLVRTTPSPGAKSDAVLQWASSAAALTSGQPPEGLLRLSDVALGGAKVLLNPTHESAPPLGVSLRVSPDALMRTARETGGLMVVELLWDGNPPGVRAWVERLVATHTALRGGAVVL